MKKNAYLIILFLFSVCKLNALEGTYVQPDGLQVTLEFRKTRVKVTIAAFPVPVWYKYTTEENSIFIEDPKSGQIEFRIKGDTLTTDALMMSGTYYKKGSKKLAAALQKIQDERLLVAATKGDLEEARKAITEQVDLNRKDKNGSTALMLAARGGHEELVDLLISAGALVNTKSSYGVTALMEGVSTGKMEIVKKLIDAKAEVNAELSVGGTALCIAANFGYADIVKLLIQKGANVNTKLSKTGETSIILAAHGMSYNHQTQEMQKAEATDAHQEIIASLIDAKADVNSSANNGDTALIVASEEGLSEIVKLLLEKGADKNKKGKNGRTALTAAESNKHTSVIEILKSEGVSPEDKN